MDDGYIAINPKYSKHNFAISNNRLYNQSKDIHLDILDIRVQMETNLERN